jgi:hypothetical protein
MNKQLSFVSLFGVFAFALIICCESVAPDSSPIAEQPAYNYVDIIIRYVGSKYGDESKPYRDSESCQLSGDNFLYIVYNSDKYDTVSVPECSLFVQYVNGFRHVKKTFYPDSNLKYTFGRFFDVDTVR